MAIWKHALPVWVDLATLPGEWELLYDPTTDAYAVAGRAHSSAAPDVVIRIDYAVSGSHADTRRMVGSAIVHGFRTVIRRHRAELAQAEEVYDR